MRKTKILIVDNDVLTRQALVRILNCSELPLDVRVCGNLNESEKAIQDENPDIVLLDLEQSALHAYALFNTLRIRFPRLPIVITSSRSEEGAQAAIYGLLNGAVDFITKPEQDYLLLFANRHLRKRLLPIIESTAQNIEREAVDRRFTKHTGRSQQGFKGVFKYKNRKTYEWPVNLVIMGGCMGAPKALLTIFKQLPADLPVPIVVVQHFPKIYTRELAKTLSKISNLIVREAYDGAELKPGIVWLARGGYHCEVQQLGNKPLLKVHRGPRENGVRPSIDILFRSASRLYGSGVLGVILSGHGSDGIAGAKAVVDAGGQVITQDPKSALAPELSLSVIKSGAADHYYSTEKISEEIIRRIAKSKQSAKFPAERHLNHSQKDRLFLKPI